MNILWWIKSFQMGLAIIQSEGWMHWDSLDILNCSRKSYMIAPYQILEIIFRMIKLNFGKLWSYNVCVNGLTIRKCAPFVGLTQSKVYDIILFRTSLSWIRWYKRYNGTNPINPSLIWDDRVMTMIWLLMRMTI